MREHKNYNLSSDKVRCMMTSILRSKENALEFIKQRGVENSAIDMNMFFCVIERLPEHGVDVRIMVKNSVFGGSASIWNKIDVF